MTVERGRGYVSADRNKRSNDDRRHPHRLDLLARAPGDLRRGAGPGGAVHQLRPPGPRHRDRRIDNAPRGAGLGRDTLRNLVGLVADYEESPQGLELGEVPDGRHAARPTSTCASRSSTSPSAPATASSGRRSTRSASWSSAPWTTSWPSPTSARSRPTRSCSAWTSAGSRSRTQGLMRPCTGTPKTGRRFGGDAAHQKAMMGNLVASLIAAESPGHHRGQGQGACARWPRSA